MQNANCGFMDKCMHLIYFQYKSELLGHFGTFNDQWDLKMFKASELHIFSEKVGLHFVFTGKGLND